MKNWLKTVFTKKEPNLEHKIIPSSLWFLTPEPTKHAFRLRAVNDMQGLIDAGEKDLAKLEAQKLIAHLQKEFEL